MTTEHATAATARHGSFDDPSFVSIASILAGNHSGDDIRVRGWIHRTRSSGKIAFLVVRDGTDTVQVTVKKGNVPDDDLESAKKALNESSVEVSGLVKADERAPGGFEIVASGLRVLHFAEDFPIKENQSTELLMDNRHLWVRSREQAHVQRVKHELLRAVRTWFHDNKFTEVTPPIITVNAAEGGSEVFAFDYFGQKAFLSQTAQMYLEALIYTHEKVYALTPSFRAEKSRTARHLTEYSHLEAEMAWMGSEQNMQVQEELITHSAHHVAANCAAELKALGRDPAELAALETPFERIDYGECVDRLQSMGFDEFAWGEDFGAPHEKALTAERAQPIMVTNFPKAIKAFYMRENPDDPRTVLCNDCLAPAGFGEIVGASERETDNAELIRKLEAEEAELDNYAWYLDLRRFGSIPHSGFGLGVERVLQWFTNQEHIRDMTPFPRTINRAYP